MAEIGSRGGYRLRGHARRRVTTPPRCHPEPQGGRARPIPPARLRRRRPSGAPAPKRSHLRRAPGSHDDRRALPPRSRRASVVVASPTSRCEPAGEGLSSSGRGGARSVHRAVGQSPLPSRDTKREKSRSLLPESGVGARRGRAPRPRCLRRTRRRSSSTSWALPKGSWKRAGTCSTTKTWWSSTWAGRRAAETRARGRDRPPGGVRSAVRPARRSSGERGLGSPPTRTPPRATSRVLRPRGGPKSATTNGGERGMILSSPAPGRSSR